MGITITAKIKILPDEQGKEELLHTIRAVKKGLNYASVTAFTKKCFVNTKLHPLTYQHLREEFGLRSQMACSVNKTVCAKYKSMKSNGVTDTLAVFKKPEYDLVWYRDYSLKPGHFSVNTLSGRIKVPYVTTGMEQFFDGTWTFGTAKLVVKKRKYFLYIPMTKEIDERNLFHEQSVKNIVGVDVGINFVATAYGSDGKTLFFNGKHMKQKRAHYKLLRKQLQQKHTASARRRLQAIGNRENRWMTDINHTVSKALVRHYGPGTLFVLEDLQNIRAATEKVCRKHRYVSVSWAFAQLRDFLTYKSLLNESKVLLEDPKYTSQTCPKCHHTDQTNRDKKTRSFCCKKCRYRSNDDRIGAMNLYHKGKEYLVRVSAQQVG